MALEAAVSNTSSWPDYLFDKGLAPKYRLAPLREVAEFVKVNHHLPGIPSAAEGAENGVSLGDMQAKLAARIEELTLHLIEAEKRNKELSTRVAKLEGGSR